MTISTCTATTTGFLLAATAAKALDARMEPGEADARRRRQRLDFVAANYAALRANTAIGKGEYLSAYAALLGCSPEARPRFAAAMRLDYGQLFDNFENEETTLDATIALLAHDAELARACDVPPASAATIMARTDGRSRTTISAHEPIRMLALNLQPRGSVRRAVADAITPMLLASLADVDGIDLVTIDDVNALFELERMRDVADCDSVSCATELGGALGARLVLHGTLGRIGPDFVLTLTVIDTHTGSATARVTDLASGRLALSAAIAGAVAELAHQIDR